MEVRSLRELCGNIETISGVGWEGGTYSSTHLGSQLRCFLFLWYILPPSIRTKYKQVSFCLITVPLFSFSGIHTLSPLTSGLEITAQWHLSKFSLCFSRCWFSFRHSWHFFGSLGFSCWGITGTVVLSFHPIRSSVERKPFSNSVDL